jgi:dihydroorotate dehydrogenase electron transfer subunit
MTPRVPDPADAPDAACDGRPRRRLITVPLLRRDSIGDSYHVLTFDDPEGLQARPGQFAMVRGAEWGDAPLLPRPMSYLTGGSTPSILIKVFGEGTIRMARAEPGEPFSLLGPLGNVWRPPTPGRRQVLVAGGVGIAPLLFFARELANAGVRPITIYGGRSARDLPLDDDLAEVSDVLLTTEDGSRGTRGRVPDVLERLLEKDVEVYTCGPDRMMARVAELCAFRDVPCEASLETPMACGYGVCLGCPVPTTDGQYLYACVHGPCIDARRVDWSRADHAPRKAVAPGRKPTA